MGMYAKYTPIRVNFDLAPNLTTSDNKLFEANLGGFYREFREFSEFMNDRK